MSNLEELVAISLRAYGTVHPLGTEQARLFELEFRRIIMKTFCNGTTTEHNTWHTYIPTGSTTGGTWTTTARNCPPLVKTEILHG
jgi:hypothetical protein